MLTGGDAVLRLKKDLLTELRHDDLASVAAAARETMDERCVSGIVRCTSDILTERLSLRTC